MSPRPILKQRSVSTDYTHHHHHQQYIHHYHHHAVHFPPSPALTRTFSAHSSAAYDRSPIVVSPNTCALPERGCPGRTYLLDEQPKARGIAYARDYHPRALAFASSNANASPYAPVPPLVPDLSSESDESDGFYNIPGDADSASAQQSFGVHGLAGPSGSGASSSSSTKYNNNGNSNGGYGYTDDAYAYAYTPDSDDAADTLHFLPHGRPTSPPSSGYMYMPSEGDIPASPPSSSVHKSRRKRGSERRHESSMDPDRIPSGGGGGGGAVVDPSSLGFGALAIGTGSGSASGRKRATSPSAIRKKGVRRTVQPMMVQLQQQGGGFGVVDDGCLGGF